MINPIPDEIMQRASEITLNMAAEPFHKHANMVASAIMEARAEGYAAAREQAAITVARIAMELGRMECCGFGQGSPPECCGRPLFMIDDVHAADTIRGMKDKSDE